MNRFLRIYILLYIISTCLLIHAQHGNKTVSKRSGRGGTGLPSTTLTQQAEALFQADDFPPVQQAQSSPTRARGHSPASTSRPKPLTMEYTSPPTSHLSQSLVEGTGASPSSKKPKVKAIPAAKAILQDISEEMQPAVLQDKLGENEINILRAAYNICVLSVHSTSNIDQRKQNPHFSLMNTIYSLFTRIHQSESEAQKSLGKFAQFHHDTVEPFSGTSTQKLATTVLIMRSIGTEEQNIQRKTSIRLDEIHTQLAQLEAERARLQASHKSSQRTHRRADAIVAKSLELYDAELTEITSAIEETEREIADLEIKKSSANSTQQVRIQGAIEGKQSALEKLRAQQQQLQILRKEVTKENVFDIAKKTIIEAQIPTSQASDSVAQSSSMTPCEQTTPTLLATKDLTDNQAPQKEEEDDPSAGPTAEELEQAAQAQAEARRVEQIASHMQAYTRYKDSSKPQDLCTALLAVLTCIALRPATERDTTLDSNATELVARIKDFLPDQKAQEILTHLSNLTMPPTAQAERQGQEYVVAYRLLRSKSEGIPQELGQLNKVKSVLSEQQRGQLQIYTETTAQLDQLCATEKLLQGVKPLAATLKESQKAKVIATIKALKASIYSNIELYVDKAEKLKTCTDRSIMQKELDELSASLEQQRHELGTHTHYLKDLNDEQDDTWNSRWRPNAFKEPEYLGISVKWAAFEAARKTALAS